FTHDTTERPAMPKKSPRKSPATGLTPLRGVAALPALRGRGPRKGAPNAGRPPSAVRAQMRDAFAARIHLLEAFADNPQLAVSGRLRALDQLARYGLGATTTQTDVDGNGPAFVRIVHEIIDPVNDG
ncbi:MAG: hypothetical protein ACK5ZZ_14835, partial [Gemmatimonadaceae bacterium]